MRFTEIFLEKNSLKRSLACIDTNCGLLILKSETKSEFHKPAHWENSGFHPEIRIAKGRCPYFVLTLSEDYVTFVNHPSPSYGFCTARPTKILHRWDSVEGWCIDTRQGDKETRRQGDKETRRQGDKETRRHGDKETWRHGDMETWRQGDKET